MFYGISAQDNMLGTVSNELHVHCHALRACQQPHLLVCRQSGRDLQIRASPM